MDSHVGVYAAVAPDARATPSFARFPRRDRLAIRAGYLVAGLLALVSFGGIAVSSAYARETPNWATQALAQDWFDLLVAAPCVAIATALASAGSRRAQLALAGGLLYAVYTLAIYAFAVHLNPLFLAYCAAFGVSLFALIGVAAALFRADVRAWFVSGVPRRTIGIVLIAIGAQFAALWLAQLVPAALTGQPPRDLAETGLPTNPIHVLDLSFVLPLHFIAGIALMRRRSTGYLLAPALLAFGSLMAASIAFLVVLLDLRGIAPGGTPIAVAMGLVAVLSAVLLVLMLRKLRAPA